MRNSAEGVFTFESNQHYCHKRWKKMSHVQMAGLIDFECDTKTLHITHMWFRQILFFCHSFFLLLVYYKWNKWLQPTRKLTKAIVNIRILGVNIWVLGGSAGSAMQVHWWNKVGTENELIVLNIFRAALSKYTVHILYTGVNA